MWGTLELNITTFSFFQIGKLGLLPSKTFGSWGQGGVKALEGYEERRC